MGGRVGVWGEGRGVGGGQGCGGRAVTPHFLPARVGYPPPPDRAQGPLAPHAGPMVEWPPHQGSHVIPGPVFEA